MSAIPKDLISITRPLRQVARRRRFLHTATGLLQLLIVALTVVLAAAVIAGSFSTLRGSARWAFSLFVEMIVLLSLVTLLAPMFRRHRLSAIAREVEEGLDGSDELLSSAVELSQDKDPRFASSPELVKHVVSQAAKRAKAIDPRAVVSLKNLPWWVLALMPVLFCWAVLMTAMPTPTLRGLHVLAFPWRPTPANLLPVTVTPGHITMAAGEQLHVVAQIAPRLRYKPRVSSAKMEMLLATGQTQTLDMSRTAARAFEQAVDLSTSFRYRILSEDGDSRWYDVTVLPRPAVTSIDVHYDYPPYTRLPAKADPRKDGAIEALVGTQATLTIHTSQPLIILPEKSHLIIAEKTDAQQVNLELAPNFSEKSPAYIAKFFITRSAPYRLDIQNTNYLKALDEPERQITATTDEPPKISILSPQQKTTATLTDTVPVKFSASDDYGLAKIEAMLQIDGQAPETFDVPFAAGDVSVDGTYAIDITALLARKNLKDANRIEYQLKATDTRDPGPQSAWSAKQLIEIDHSARAAAQRDVDAAKELEKAIKQAQADLRAQQDTVKPLAESKDRAFSAANRKAATGAKDKLLDTAQSLQKAAEQAAADDKSPVADVAKAVAAVAREQIEPAAEDAASAVALDADQPPQRQKDLAASEQKIEQAQDALEKLLYKLKFEVPKRELAKNVDDIAKRQDQIAREMADAAEQKKDPQQAVREQQALNQRLDELLNQNKDLNTQSAREAAERNQQLVRRVEQLEDQQKRMEGQAEKQAATDAAQAKVNDFAEKQKELNKSIAQLAKEDEQPLKDAAARTPDQQKLDNVVKTLQQPSQAPQGNQQQRDIARELKDASRRLDENAKRDDSAMGRRQQQGKADEKRAADAAKDAADAAKSADQADDRSKAQARQKEQQLAQKLDAQANEMKSHATTDEQRQAAQDAKDKVAEARESANEGDAKAAGEKLAEAAQKLESAAKAQADAAAEERKQMTAASKAASDLADAQQKLADETAKATQDLAQARAQQGDPNTLERGQQQAQNEAKQAADEAGRTSDHDRQQASQQMADRAAKAQKALSDAAEHEKSAAAAAHDHQSAQASAEQKAAEKSLEQAEQSLRGSDGNANDPATQLQEARAAQQEAMNRRPEAAQQAARALQQAAQALSAQANNGQQQQPQPAQASQQQPPKQTAVLESKEGAAPTGLPNADARPDSVKQIGISASDWARLPPLTQQQLLNAAQQPGPPEYREQIKKYFVKIAKLQAEGK